MGSLRSLRTHHRHADGSIATSGDRKKHSSHRLQWLECLSSRSARVPILFYHTSLTNPMEQRVAARSPYWPK